MKTFENPDIQIKHFAVEDIITTSGDGNIPKDPNGNATPFN